MDNIPIPRQTLEAMLAQTGFDSGRLAIREVNRLASLLEAETGIKFVRMEFGVPNIPPPPQAAAAEREALEAGAHGAYPPFDGIPQLKRAGVRFLKAFLDLEVGEECVVATCGSMQGGFVAQALAARMHPGRETILFLDPTFPVSQLQARFLGLPRAGLELGDLRGDALLAALESRLERGDIGGVFWSSPNNPSWACLTEAELEGIARLDLSLLHHTEIKTCTLPLEKPFRHVGPAEAHTQLEAWHARLWSVEIRHGRVRRMPAL